MSLNIIHNPLSLSSSNSSISNFYSKCYESVVSLILGTIHCLVLALFVFPLCILVLCIGFQRWRHQSTTGHGDVIAYHTAAVESFSILGAVLYIGGAYSSEDGLVMAGAFSYCIVYPCHTLLHCLTCVEHYLAVVHPVTYQRLKQTVGVMLRNVSLGLIWLLGLGWIGVTFMSLPNFPAVPLLILLGMSVAVVLFLFFSVLKVLTHPGPGAGPRERVDQAKRRALHMISAVVGVLLLRSVPLMLSTGLTIFEFIEKPHHCTLIDSAMLLTLPSNLVQPLLFLHRAGKLACCRQNVESG